MDAAINEALEMPKGEERSRMQRLWASTRERDLAWWTREMLAKFGVRA
jgi:trehalose-6-phosphate synthase